MRKFRLCYDKEKEEKWLNEMCRQGWGMINYFMGFYTFEPCSLGEYTYQIDLPALRAGKDSRDQKKREYIEFVEATGAEYICSWALYMIFRKETAKGAFKLYTDAESEQKLLQRIRVPFFWVGLLELFISIFQTVNYINYINYFWSPNLIENVLMLISVCTGYAATTLFAVLIIRITRRINKLESEK